MDPMQALMMMFGGSGGGAPTPPFAAPASGAPAGGGPVGDKIKGFLKGLGGVANAANTAPRISSITPGGGGQAQPIQRVNQGGDGQAMPGNPMQQPDIRALLQRIFSGSGGQAATPPVAPINPTTPAMGRMY